MSLHKVRSVRLDYSWPCWGNGTCFCIPARAFATQCSVSGRMNNARLKVVYNHGFALLLAISFAKRLLREDWRANRTCMLRSMCCADAKGRLSQETADTQRARIRSTGVQTRDRIEVKLQRWLCAGREDAGVLLYLADSAQGSSATRYIRTRRTTDEALMRGELYRGSHTVTVRPLNEQRRRLSNLAANPCDVLKPEEVGQLIA